MKTINLRNVCILICLIYANTSQAQNWLITGNAAGGTDFIGTTNSIPFKIYTANAEVARFQTTGELGIGVTSNSSWLHVKSTGTKETFRTDVPSTYDNYWRMYRNGTEYGRLLSFDGGNAFYIQAARGHLRLASGNTGTAIPSFAIIGSNGSDAGFVGIGDYTSYTPKRLLDVYSNSNNPQFRITYTESSIYTDMQTTSDGDLFINPKNGSKESNVTIGTSTPTYV